jgi:periplasmic protein TonB
MKPGKAFIISMLMALLFNVTASARQFHSYSIHTSLIKDTIPGIDTNDIVFEKAEIEAEFPGGESAWRSYLEQNLNANTPVDHGAPAGSYTVWIQFIVGKDGKLSDLKMLTHHGYGMETEVMRILRKSPPWSPAQLNGRTVKAYRKQPVTFVVIDERKRKRHRD